MKVVAVIVKLKKKNKTKYTILIVYFRLFEEKFHGHVLSIRVYSADEHSALIVSLRGWTLSRHVINLNQLESERT